MKKLIELSDPWKVLLFTGITFVSSLSIKNSWLYCLSIFLLSSSMFLLSNIKKSTIPKILFGLYSITLGALGVVTSYMVSKWTFIMSIIILTVGILYALSNLFLKGTKKLISLVFYSLSMSIIIIFPEISLMRAFVSASMFFALLSYFSYRDIKLSLSDNNKLNVDLLSSKIGIFKTRNLARAFSIMSIFSIIVYSIVSSNLLVNNFILSTSIFLMMIAMFTNARVSEKILLIVLAAIILSTIGGIL